MSSINKMTNIGISISTGVVSRARLKLIWVTWQVVNWAYAVGVDPVEGTEASF